MDGQPPWAYVGRSCVARSRALNPERGCPPSALTTQCGEPGTTGVGMAMDGMAIDIERR
jgi:hypothetical protein